MTMADVLVLLKLPVTEFVFRGEQLPPILALVDDTLRLARPEYKRQEDQPIPIAVHLVRGGELGGFTWHYDYASHAPTGNGAAAP